MSSHVLGNPMQHLITVNGFASSIPAGSPLDTPQSAQRKEFNYPSTVAFKIQEMMG